MRRKPDSPEKPNFDFKFEISLNSNAQFSIIFCLTSYIKELVDIFLPVEGVLLKLNFVEFCTIKRSFMIDGKCRKSQLLLLICRLIIISWSFSAISYYLRTCIKTFLTTNSINFVTNWRNKHKNSGFFWNLFVICLINHFYTPLTKKSHCNCASCMLFKSEGMLEAH